MNSASSLERFASDFMQKPVEKIDFSTVQERAQTLVKDDLLWKELQQELRKAKAVSPMAIQDVTRKFTEKHQMALDEGLKRQAEQSKANCPDPLPRSSFHMIALTSLNVRRALSLGSDSPFDASATKASSAAHRQGSISRDSQNKQTSAAQRRATFQRDTQNHQALNLGTIRDSVNSMSIGGRFGTASMGDMFLPSRNGARNKMHRSADDVLNVLNAATNLRSATKEDQDASSDELLDTHLECDNESMCSGDGMASDDDLLVMFPKGPRRKTASSKLKIPTAA